MLKRRQSLVLLIDGADLIHDAGGELVSDWLPEKMPQRVSLVLSVSAESMLLESLKQRKDAVFIPLEHLAPPDRAAIVRKDLALHGKKLEESAFNNQLSERIQKLPISLPLMMQHLLGCLEQDHGLELVAITVVSLWASRDGLMERDLYSVLTMWKELNETTVTLEKAINAGRHVGSFPTALFFDLLRSLRGLLGACGSPSELPGSRLQLCGAPLRMAVERRYLKKPGLEHTAHVFLAAHWWKLSDPDGSRTFQKSEAEALTALPYHLVVSTHLHLGLLRSLSEAYALYATAAGSEPSEAVNLFADFLQRNFGLLSQNPLLLLQQAANEPSSSDLCSQARAALQKCGRPFLKWINKPERVQQTKRVSDPALWEAAQGHVLHQWDFPCPLNCVTFHPMGQLVATGGWDRSVTVLDANGISKISVMKDHDASIHSISFSSTGKVLAAATLAGSITLWSWQEAIILGSFKAHSGCISAARFLSDEKLLTAGEDCKVQICKGHLGQLWTSLGSRDLSPALCVASNLDGSRLAVGHHSDGIWIYSQPWRFQTSRIHLQGSDVAVCSLAWLHHVFLVVGLGDGSLCVWKTFESSSDCCHQFKAHEKAVMGLAVSEKLVASASGLDFQLCLDWHHVGEFGEMPRACTSGLLRRRVPKAELSGSHDGTVCLWDSTNSECIQKFLGHQSPICGITTEKDHVISMGRDGLLITWNLQGVEETRFLAHPSQTNNCTGFRDPWQKDFMLAAAGADGTVKIWRPLTIEQPQVLFGHSASVCAAVATSSSFLTISKDKTARIWAVPKNDAVAWSPGGNLAASGGEHGDLIVWQGGELLGMAKVGPQCISALGFHSSHTILVACDGISLWDISDSTQNVKAVSLTCRRKLWQTKGVSVLCMGTLPSLGTSVCGLSDGHLLILQPGDESFQKVTNWVRIKRPDSLNMSNGHRTSLQALSPLPDWSKIHCDKITALHLMGDRIVTASCDQDVKIWDGSTMKLIGQFRCRAPVSCLQPCPRKDSSVFLMVGDTLGSVYFLDWDCLRV
ncbi:hypothetical protein Chor_009581 [Crotalus horridus]